MQQPFNNNQIWRTVSVSYEIPTEEFMAAIGGPEGLALATQGAYVEIEPPPNYRPQPQQQQQLTTQHFDQQYQQYDDQQYDQQYDQQSDQQYDQQYQYQETMNNQHYQQLNDQYSQDPNYDQQTDNQYQRENEPQTAYDDYNQYGDGYEEKDSGFFDIFGDSDM